MPESDSAAVERIIANTINETARGDPHALASRIVAALAAAGYGTVPANRIEDTALGPQPFDKLTREMRPQVVSSAETADQLGSKRTARGSTRRVGKPPLPPRIRESRTAARCAAESAGAQLYDLRPADDEV